MVNTQEPAGGSDLMSGIRDHFAAQSPNLGYGKQSEASIDSVNQWMRAQPWYQQIRGNSPKINDAQRRQILKAAQANGIVVDEGDMEVDPSGNFNPKGHKLRNTLIVAGAAAAALTGGAALGAFGGAGAAGGAAGAGAAGGGTLASTTIGSGMLGPIAGGAGLAGAGAAGAGTLAASQIGSGMLGPITGGTSGAGMMGGAGAAGGGIAREIGTAAGDVAKDSFKHNLGSALAGLGAAGVGRMIGGGDSGSNIPPELQQLLAMSMKQQQDLDPLRQNVTRGVNAMLPTFARGTT